MDKSLIGKPYMTLTIPPIVHVIFRALEIDSFFISKLNELLDKTEWTWTGDFSFMLLHFDMLFMIVIFSLTLRAVTQRVVSATAIYFILIYWLWDIDIILWLEESIGVVINQRAFFFLYVAIAQLHISCAGDTGERLMKVKNFIFKKGD